MIFMSRDDAYKKLADLLTCGDDRIELAAAKELMSIYAKSEDNTDKDVKIEVTIKIIEN